MQDLLLKLQIKPKSRWLIHHPPINYLETIGKLPSETIVTKVPDGEFDGIQLFIKCRTELIKEFKIINKLLKPNTIFWVTYPKKSSGIASDLEMTGSWAELADFGLSIVSAISINETWTALRFKPNVAIKVSAVSNNNIKNNLYSEFIDVENKLLILPPELKSALTQSELAFNFYQKLSYSNKKEYVLWVITAKQEKTKKERIEKMVVKLLQGKKNPSE